MPDSTDPTSLSRPARRRIGEARKVKQRSTSSQSPIKLVPVHKGKLYSPNDFPLWRRKTSPVPEIWWRVGVPTEYNIEEMSDAVREAWVRTLSLLASKGHEIIPISLPTTKHALSAYYVLAPAEASSNLARYDGVRYGTRTKDHADSSGGLLYSETRRQNFGEEVKRRILLGSYSLSAAAIDNYFIQAQKVRRLVQEDFDGVFKMANPMRISYETPPDGVDYIICPTAPTPPPLLEDVRKSTPLDAYMNDVFTVPASLAGLPAISVPAPSAEHVSSVEENFIGMQVIGQYGDDYGVLQFASQQLEVGHDWNALRVSAHERETRRIR
jgi:aspartyl-tRNA(Asn)/glutamyl-tRNA(Gln) amidotransferase subunit A